MDTDNYVKIFVEYDGISFKTKDRFFRLSQEDDSEAGPLLVELFEEFGISAEWEEVY